MTLALGDRVRVADRPHEGHHRTPGYLKGRSGRVVRLHGAFRNPETRAYGHDGEPRVRLYLVAFERRDVWPSATDGNGCVYADVFEHWLEPAA